MKELPEGFRKLDDDELILKNDICREQYSNDWNVVLNDTFLNITVQQAKEILGKTHYVFAAKECRTNKIFTELIFKEPFRFLQSLNKCE